ncbi:MAG: restriction endonuclease [Candidatus Hydrogenedentes bacterium]|nr:restriction endonuclease [Candidatus Hydrogenedentota bacterium]
MTTANRTPKVWLVRAGKYGDQEEKVLQSGRAIIEFREVGDLSKYDSAEAVAEAWLKAEPKASPNRAGNLARQAWAFASAMEVGDIVVLPLKTRAGQIALGTVSGPYQFVDIDGEMRHTRPVQWATDTVSRSTFEQDLLYSFGAFMTVCRIQRNDAERRVAAVLASGKDPGPSRTQAAIATGGGQSPVDPLEPQSIDIAQAAHDDIVAFVRTRFAGHDLARLVEALLQAEGFMTHRSAPGPDGGADILAGHGPLGLDEPTLCVQVKATENPADVDVLRALQGAVTNFRATQGLLVSWNGFTKSAKNEARLRTFSIRLWDQVDLVQSIYRNYEKLSPEIQTELPLMRVWTLVPSDAESAD